MPSSNSDSQNRKKNVARGREFENLAANYLIQHGYDILEKNWQAGHKEIDLIARVDDTLVFVEVKSASSLRYGHPVERVDEKKIRNLTTAARQYMLAKEVSGCDLRFDVITFLGGKLEHFPAAFDALEK